MKTFHQVLKLVKLAAGQNLHSRSIFPLPALNETVWNPWYISMDSTALAFTAESPSKVSRDVTVSDAEGKVTRRFTGFCGLQEAVREWLSELSRTLAWNCRFVASSPRFSHRTAFTELILSLTNSIFFTKVEFFSAQDLQRVLVMQLSESRLKNNSLEV